MLIVKIGLGAALIAVVAYGRWEIHRWKTLDYEEFTQRRRGIRLWGFITLLVVLTLFLIGAFLPQPRTKLALANTLGYWSVTALLTLPLFPLALLDARENLQTALIQRQRLREDIFASSTETPAQDNE